MESDFGTDDIGKRFKATPERDKIQLERFIGEGTFHYVYAKADDPKLVFRIQKKPDSNITGGDLERIRARMATLLHMRDDGDNEQIKDALKALLPTTVSNYKEGVIINPTQSLHNYRMTDFYQEVTRCSKFTKTDLHAHRTDEQVNAMIKTFITNVNILAEHLETRAYDLKCENLGIEGDQVKIIDVDLGPALSISSVASQSTGSDTFESMLFEYDNADRDESTRLAARRYQMLYTALYCFASIYNDTPPTTFFYEGGTKELPLFNSLKTSITTLNKLKAGSIIKATLESYLDTLKVILDQTQFIDLKYATSFVDHAAQHVSKHWQSVQMRNLPVPKWTQST